MRQVRRNHRKLIDVGQERIILRVAEHLSNVVGRVGDLHVDDPAVLLHQFVFGIDETAVRLDVERIVAVADLLVQLGIDRDGILLDQRLAGFVVALGLDALQIGRASCRERV